MRNLILLLFVALFSTYGCKKDSENFVFIEKPYHPESVEVIKAKVANFVDHTTAGVSERNPFPNTEVNEAKWDMEAAANFLHNDNLGEKVITEVQTFSFMVNNIMEGGVLKMVGTDLTAKFQDLVSQISAAEIQIGTVGVLADINLEHVTASTSQISVLVAFAQELEASTLSFESAANQATYAINRILPVPACIQWNPSITIHNYVQGGIGSPLAPWDTRTVIDPTNGNFIPPSMNYYQGLEINYPYPPNWLQNDAAAAYSVAKFKVANYNAQHPNEPTKYLRRVLVRSAIWTYPSGFEKSLYVSSVIAADGAIICYEE